MSIAKVYLVGAGPGDPGLLTVRAASLLAQAEIILYDALVDERILALAKSNAQLISVGKRAGGARTEQNEINRLLVSQARTGRIVVRLKGGDPFLFGRGGEEALALVEAGIPFEVVPGVTAAVAAGAYAGIPLTHRGLASACIFVTGHEDPTKPASDINWSALARSKATLCIYMGLAQLEGIAKTLIKEGRPADEPAAVIGSATQPEQRTVVSTLAGIAQAVAQAGVQVPAVLIVGPVAQLRQKLSWFDRRPLFGMSVVVTRPAEQSVVLVESLTALGARPVLFPTIATSAIDDLAPLDHALRNLATFDWVVFSSANAVRVFFERLGALGLDARVFGSSRVAVMGPGTADAIAQRGIHPDCVPTVNIAESLFEAILSTGPLAGKRVLLPRSDIGRATLADGLRRAGADVSELVIYRTICARPTRQSVERLLASRPDVLTFTSGSTVANFVEILGEAPAKALAAKATVASIGPVTSEALRQAGLSVHIEASNHSTAGLVEAIADHFAAKKS